MPYTFTLTATITATPEQVYETWLNSIGHSEMTGSEATMSDEVGAEVSAWDGYISGRNLELVPGERIVQSWRTTEFGDDDEDSVIIVTLQEIEEGTLLTLEHGNVPDAHRSYEEGGWRSSYFEPMVAYFTELKEDVAEPALYQAPLESAPEAAHEQAVKQPAKSGSRKSAGTRSASKKTSKARRAVSATPSRRPAPRKASSNRKAAPKKSKGKAGSKTRATTARTRAKSRARKPVRPKRR
jgi:uncharacterized protein YndB with AHSA1/START domain